MSTDLYQDHARRLAQIAAHIEKSLTPNHRIAFGGPGPVSSNDTDLVTTLFTSIYGHPTGRDSVLALAKGLKAGEERQMMLGNILSFTVSASEFDQSISYSLLSLPNKELHTAQLFKEAAAYSQRRADALVRTIPPPTRNVLQIGR